MIPSEPLKGSGREPLFIKGIRSWGSDVVRSLRTMQQFTGAVMADSDHVPSLSAWFQHRNEFSSSQPLEVAAGYAVRDTDELAISTVNISIPASGNLYVYVVIALGAGTASITSSAIRPDYRPDTDTVNAVLGILTEETTGYWSWTPYHIGDIILETIGAGGGDTNLAYPFEGSIVGNTIKIGANRALATYFFHDHIVIGNDELAKTVAETSATISADSYVYYAITKSGALPAAALTVKTVASGWPSNVDGTVNYVLGVAEYSGSVTAWHPQHISGHILIHARVA